MSRYKIIHAVPVAIVIVSLAISGGAARAEVALGASLGYTHLSYPDIPNFTNDIIGIPGSAEWSQPGIRVGYLPPGHRWDVNADVGFVHRSGTMGNDETTVELLPQVQANARARSGFSPFVNGGGGFMHETALLSASTSVSATRPVFGAGIGVRKSVSDDHGFVRVELRYDHLSKHVQELSPTESFTFPATNLFSVKLGFDLLVAR
jgi:hypothetical protein